MAEMQKIIDAEKSDLFDVLAFVAFARAPIARRERAESARRQVHASFNDKQQAFLDFVLSQYEKEGVQELEEGIWKFLHGGGCEEPAEFEGNERTIEVGPGQ